MRTEHMFIIGSDFIYILNYKYICLTEVFTFFLRIAEVK